MLRIRELRLENNLTQKELAEKISSTSKNIWAYENQISIPPLDVLIKLADFFNCSIDYLANHSDDFGNVVIHTTAPAPQLSDEEKELLENYRKLPSGLKSCVGLKPTGGSNPLLCAKNTGKRRKNSDLALFFRFFLFTEIFNKILLPSSLPLFISLLGIG